MNGNCVPALKLIPDIVVGVAGKNFMFEIKDGKKTASQKKLTPAQVKFHDEWNGQINVIENVENIGESVADEISKILH
jgi:hypothetical protein